MCQAMGHENNQILIFAPWGAPAAQTPWVGGLPAPKPPEGALGAPQGTCQKRVLIGLSKVLPKFYIVLISLNEVLIKF